MLKLYHAPATRSARIVWLLEELGDVPCEVITPDFVMPDQHIHTQNTPTGKYPTLTDGDLTIFESAAIIDHIIMKHADGRMMPPPGSDAAARCRQWMGFAEGGLATPLNLLAWYKYFDQDQPGKEHTIARMAGWASDSLNALAADFGSGPWLLGADISAADIMIGYTLYMAKGTGCELPAPLDGYFQQVEARPGFQKGMGR